MSEYVNKSTQAFDCWEMGKKWYGKQNAANAQKAAQRMKQEGWTFAGYDQTYGEELYHPPTTPTKGTGVSPVVVALIVGAVVFVLVLAMIAGGAG